MNSDAIAEYHFTQFRTLLDGIKDLLEVTGKFGVFGDVFNERVRCLLNLVGGNLGERSTARRTVLFTSPESGAASRTLVENRVHAAVFVCRESVVCGDVAVHLLLRDAGIGLELRRVLDPESAVLDFLLVHPLAYPTGDSRLAEVMRVEAVCVDAGFLAYLPDATREILIRERAVLVVSNVLDLVDERGVGFVAARMYIEPVSEVSARPSEWDRAGGVLDVGVLVHGNSRRVSREINIADTQGRDGRDAHTCVGEEGDHRFVARAARGVYDIVYLLAREELVGVDTALRRGSDMYLVVPVASEVPEELSECLTVAPKCVFLKSPVVVEREQKLIHVVGTHLDERDVGAFGTKTQTVEIRDQRPEFDFPILMTDELADRFAVAVIDVGFTEETALVLELALVFLDIIRVNHRKGFVLVDYKLSVSSSGRIRTAVNGSKGRYD